MRIIVPMVLTFEFYVKGKHENVIKSLDVQPCVGKC